jgi:hypothetical protein
MTGCHQPVETITGSDVPVAWFSQGLRIIDFSNPMRSRPASGAGSGRGQCSGVARPRGATLS